jgi:hypothetical protein
MALSIPFISSTEDPDNTQARQAASKLAQKAVTPWFFSTIWFPFASYIWTLVWMLSGFFAQRVGAGKVTLFSRSHKAIMVVMDLFWFFAIAIFVTVILMLICGGTGSTLGSFGAWLLRLGLKAVTLGGINFDFCKEINI